MRRSRGLLGAVSVSSALCLLVAVAPSAVAATGPVAALHRPVSAPHDSVARPVPFRLGAAGAVRLAGEADRVGRQLSASYGPGGASFSGAGVSFGVGRVSLGRGQALATVAGNLVHRAGSTVTFGQGPTIESFRASGSGVEQSFRVAARPGGSGPLVIEVPVKGLAAVADGPAIDLTDSTGRVRATYSGLRVTDRTGGVVPASMQVVSHGHVIAIDVTDGGAAYPLSVDPTWTQVAEPTASDGAASDQFGGSVSVSGGTAVIGAATHAVSGHAGQGAAYVFAQSASSWSQAAELTSSDGAAGDHFGASVGVSGGIAVVGAPAHAVSGHAGQGAAYVFTLSGTSWSQAGELTSSDGAAGDGFGTSVSISGSTIVVGASAHAVSGHAGQGAAYVFTLSGTSWSQAGELTSSDGAAGDGFGTSVSISGSTIVVGASAHAVSGHAGQGAAYVFTASGSTWSQAAELTASDGAAGDGFGTSVGVSGSSVTVGAPGHAVSGHAGQGAAYVFTLSGSSWPQSGELTASDGASGDQFGDAVTISGATAVVGARDHTVSSSADEGDAYVFVSSGGSWSQSAELTASDGAANDQFGQSASLSGTTAVIGGWDHTVSGHAGQGAAYVLSSGLVQPQGSGFGADGFGGGSPSEPCIECIPGSSTTTSVTANKQVINPATGDVYVTATDVSLPGAGIPLSFSRTYDAQAAQAEVTAGAAAPALGFGWSDNLGVNLVYDSGTQTATVTEENGAQVLFTPYVSGTSPAWCTSATNFCSMAPRVAATLNHNSGGTWTFIRTTGSQDTFTFSSAGALTQMADPENDTLTPSAYSPGTGQTACPASNTCTVWTSSASGRQLVLAVNGSGRLTEVFDANSSLAATLAYSGSGCTSWGSSQTPDLCSVTDPGSIASSFTYDSGNATAAYDYDLLTDTLPGTSGTSTNTFTSGLVTQVSDPTGAVTTYAYTGSNSSFLGGATTISAYPNGTGSGKPQNITVNDYSANVLIEQTTAAGTTASASRFFQIDPVSLMPLWSVDGDGNVTYFTYQTYNGTGGTPISSANVLTATDAVGNVTQAAYNSYNQAWCSVDAADYANGKRCPSTAPSSPPSPVVRITEGPADSITEIQQF